MEAQVVQCSATDLDQSSQNTTNKKGEENNDKQHLI